MARKGNTSTTFPNDTWAELEALAAEFGGTRPLSIPQTVDKLIAEHKAKKTAEATA
jgi:hypothetical protein